MGPRHPVRRRRIIQPRAFPWACHRSPNPQNRNWRDGATSGSASRSEGAATQGRWDHRSEFGDGRWSESGHPNALRFFLPSLHQRHAFARRILVHPEEAMTRKDLIAFLTVVALGVHRSYAVDTVTVRMRPDISL